MLNDSVLCKKCGKEIGHENNLSGEKVYITAPNHIRVPLSKEAQRQGFKSAYKFVAVPRPNLNKEERRDELMKIELARQEREALPLEQKQMLDELEHQGILKPLQPTPERRVKSVPLPSRKQPHEMSDYEWMATRAKLREIAQHEGTPVVVLSPTEIIRRSDTPALLECECGTKAKLEIG